MKKYTLKDFAEQVIHENAEPMTASEIWQYGPQLTLYEEEWNKYSAKITGMFEGGIK